MLIKIDYRESDLLEKINVLNKKAHIIVKSENLPLGDIIICDDNGNEKVIIERKTLKDLAASIRDGRYKEQGFRLNECDLHNHNIFYLLEGNIQTYKAFTGSVDKYALLSSMVSITYYKGFSLYKSNNLDESAEWLLQLAYKLDKEGGNPFYTVGNTSVGNTTVGNTTVGNTSVGNTSVGNTSVELGVTNNLEDIKYSTVLKRTKKNNITLENIGEIMLSQIPNVSTVVAIAIMDRYKTLKNLIDALSLDKNVLNTIKTLNKNGQARKINKTSIDNIYNFLLGIPNLVVDTNTI